VGGLATLTFPATQVGKAAPRSLPRYDATVRPPGYDHAMIANANDEQYMSIVQAMIDLDFSDSLDESRLTRIQGMIPFSYWEGVS
jgi:hypothetical protein